MEPDGEAACYEKTPVWVPGSRQATGAMAHRHEEEQGGLAGLPNEKLLQAPQALALAPDNTPFHRGTRALGEKGVFETRVVLSLF